MEILLEIIKISMPAILVLVVVNLMLNRFMQREEMRIKEEHKRPIRKKTLPMMLQAHERMVLFLERIDPDNLLQRVQISEISALKLQHVLIKNIRQEYEHNLTQQLYVSEEAWKAVTFSKESISNLVKSAYDNLPKDATALHYAELIIAMYHSTETTPTGEAIKQIKSELREIIK